MKYLDEPILATVTITGGVAATGTYRFDVKDMTDTIVFSGNAFLKSGDTKFNFYLNDIADAHKDSLSLLEKPLSYLYNEPINLFDTYTVSLYNGDSTYTASVNVAHIYRYPNASELMNSRLFEFTYSGADKWMNCMQGLRNGVPVLTPRIPYMFTSEYGFGVALEVNREQSMQLTGDGGINFPGFDVDFDAPSSITFWTLDELFDETTSKENGQDGHLYIDDKKVADIDMACFGRYYVLWQDRFGGIQSQPFHMIDTFSESMSRSTITNSIGHKRVRNVDITPKWEVQTGYINEELYPYYESILVSPRVILYDSDNDKSYNVIPTDTSYTEKTVDNQQRKFFNIKYTFEENKHQIVKY